MISETLPQLQVRWQKEPYIFKHASSGYNDVKKKTATRNQSSKLFVDQKWKRAAQRPKNLHNFIFTYC